jgi:hypothetical protein
MYRFLLTSLLILVGSITYAQTSSERWRNVQQQVLSHYEKGDTLKLKAARFLLRNMPYHFTKKGETLDKYYSEISKINKEYKYPDCIAQYDILYNTLGDPNRELKKVCDTEVISAASLIKNIDLSYEEWKHGNWARHLSFDQFCEYLLPYRVGEENFEEWRDDLSKQYKPRIEWMKYQYDKCNSAYWAALYMNDQIKNLKFNIYAVLPNSEVENPLMILRNMRMGECNDYAKLTAYIMRASGIPVGIDFTPQWPFRSSGHCWNTLLDNSGRNVPFMGGESNPGYPCKAGYVMAKVYRRTFSYQSQSLFALNQNINESVPQNLNTPFVKDVTEEYLQGVSLHVDLNGRHYRKNNFIYLSVFDNQNWIPVAYAPFTKDGKADFEKMGRGIVYLPTYWGANGAVAADHPIEVKSDGTVHRLIPNMKKTQTVTMTRKFPVFGGVLWYSTRMINGYFEASNSADFSNAVKCATIKQDPLMRYDSVRTEVKDKYRYWRYVSPDKGYCNVAEIIFSNKGKVLPYQQITSDGDSAKDHTALQAFDHDALTFYESKAASRGWIGVDMGKSVSVDQIIYLPRNDDNNVSPGQLYQLCYYDDGKSKPIGTVTATSYNITFKNVPSNALYILHDLTRGQEERIFTYNNGNINWY